MDYKKIKFDYLDLKLRIIKYFGDQRTFAKAMGMDYTALNERLNNKRQWKGWQIIKACDMLEIPLAEVHAFFYKRKVEKTSTCEV